MKQKNQKGISTWLGISIIVLVAIILFGGVFGYEYYVGNSKSKVQSSNQVQNPQTAGWKTSENTMYGYTIKYPADLFVEENPAGGIFSSVVYQSSNSYNNPIISVTIKKTSSSLEQSVQTEVQADKNMAQDAAAPFSETYKLYTLGNLQGYLITGWSGDIYKNTDEKFEIQHGNQIITFSYVYQGYIFDKSIQQGIIENSSETEEQMQAEIQPKIDLYNEIQEVISTFQFTQ